MVIIAISETQWNTHLDPQLYKIVKKYSQIQQQMETLFSLEKAPVPPFPEKPGVLMER